MLHITNGDIAVQRIRAGHEVLENRKDAVRLQRIDRWLSGTHLPGTVWRWDGQKQRLLAPS